MALGSFLTEDSYLGNIENPLTLNRYSYCVGNPVNYVDPSGHSMLRPEARELLSLGAKAQAARAQQAIRNGIEKAYEKYPEQTQNAVEWIYDVNARNNLFVQGLRDSVREADPYYISARRNVENYIVENVERADIWTSYYAGRCGGDMINEGVAYTKLGLMVLSGYYTGGAMGGSLEGFFSRFTLRGALANGGGMLIPGTAVAAGSEVGAVVIGTLGGINLVDVWLRRTEASQGMGEAIRKGRQKAEVEKAGSYTYENGTYEKADYHGSTNSGRKNRAPANGQAALDNSVSIKETTTRRVGISDGEIVVFDETTEGVFHGHVRTWDELTDVMKNALKKAGMVTQKGKIINQ